MYKELNLPLLRDILWSLTENKTMAMGRIYQKGTDFLFIDIIVWLSVWFLVELIILSILRDFFVHHRFIKGIILR